LEVGVDILAHKKDLNAVVAIMLATKGRAKEELRIDGVKLQIEMPREHPIDTVLGFQGLSALFVIKIDKPQSRSFSHANLSTLLMNCAERFDEEHGGRCEPRTRSSRILLRYTSPRLSAEVPHLGDGSHPHYKIIRGAEKACHKIRVQ